MTSCIVGKKIRAMGPGPLELFPFVVLAILMARHTKYAMGVYSFCLFCVSVSLSVCLSFSQYVNIYFVSKISQELLYLET